MCLCLAVRGIPKHRLLEAWQFLSCSSFSLFFPDSVRTRAVPAWLIAPPDESGPLACLIRGNFNRFWWRVVVAGPSCVSDSGESDKQNMVTSPPWLIHQNRTHRGEDSQTPRREDYLSARPAEPSCLQASTTRAAIEDSASRPHERGS